MDKAATPFARRLKRIKTYFAYAAIAVCRSLPGAALRNAGQFGQSLEFAWWITRTFGPNTRFFATREQLWHRMLSSFAPNTTLTVCEFGVAYGYITRWWIDLCPMVVKWYGFDTFTGLPIAWQHFPIGAFDAKGNPPGINDPRIEWVIGKVEDTFCVNRFGLNVSRSDDRAQRIFFFDLDLYEPTKHVVTQILPHLWEGDILYFDEAANMDERRVLIEEMDTIVHNTHLIGSTPVALALRRIK